MKTIEVQTIKTINQYENSISEIINVYLINHEDEEYRILSFPYSDKKYEIMKKIKKYKSDHTNYVFDYIEILKKKGVIQ